MKATFRALTGETSYTGRPFYTGQEIDLDKLPLWELIQSLGSAGRTLAKCAANDTECARGWDVYYYVQSRLSHEDLPSLKMAYRMNLPGLSSLCPFINLMRGELARRVAYD